MSREHLAVWRRGLAVLLLCLTTDTTPAAEKAPPPAVESDPRLQADGEGWRLDKAAIVDTSRPRVLLIGDSIVGGYHKHVLEQLDGRAYVDIWIHPHCQSERLNQILAEVLKNGPYDVVHFNMGLHGWPQGRIKDGTFEPLTAGFVQVIREACPDATVIWASTTPVTTKGKPCSLDPAINPTIVDHNRMAANVMAREKVPINDFYRILVDRLDLAVGDQFHWSGPAYTLLGTAATAAIQEALDRRTLAPVADPVRVVVWDERQPTQKQAYETFLGDYIAEHLAARDGIAVRSVGIDDGEQGLAPAMLDFAEVLIWWGHVRHDEITPPRGRDIVQRVKSDGLTLAVLHSAHFATPFMEAMSERTREDVRRRYRDVPREALTIEEIPAGRRIPRRDERLTPTVEERKTPEGTIVRVHMPLCVFPTWKNHGAPSTLTMLEPQHPVLVGLPATFTLPRTEMYDEPFHVPEPDVVLAEETWGAGHRFRSVMLWHLGEGRVIYIRPGHETYPIYKDPHMLQLLENIVRSSRKGGKQPRQP